MNLNQLPVVIRRDVPTAQLPAVYETAKRALAECVRLDECKDWLDKAAALASYARQAKNTTLEDHAKRIRKRALERAGQLLLEIKAHRGTTAKGAGRESAMTSAGMRIDEGQTAMRLAAAPKSLREKIIDSGPETLAKIRAALPARQKRHGFTASDSYRSVVGGNLHGARLTSFLCVIRTLNAVQIARRFTSDEADRIRPSLREVSDWLDEFERNLPKAGKP